MDGLVEFLLLLDPFFGLLSGLRKSTLRNKNPDCRTVLVETTSGTSYCKINYLVSTLRLVYACVKRQVCGCARMYSRKEDTCIVLRR